MARTLNTSRMSFFAVSVWCLLLVVVTFHSEGVQAASNSSSNVASSDGQSNPDDEGGTAEKGMRPFFDMVQSFLGVVQPNKITEQSWLNLSRIIQDGKFQSGEINDWKNWCKYLVGFLVCAAVGLLFFIVMPIVGLVFCCCRCCGRCGAKPKVHDPKHAVCKRRTYCTLLIVLNTVALAGVVCAFMSNQILYDKMQNEGNRGPVGKLVRSAELVNDFANTTVEEVVKAVLGRFQTARTGILNDVTSSASRAVDSVLDTLNASSLLDQAKTVGSDVSKTQQELNAISDTLHDLSTQGSQLAGNLSEIRSDIDGVCPSANACPGYNSADYEISANFSGLDALSSQASNVAKAANLSQYITTAEETIDSAKSDANKSVANGINSATGSIDDLEKSIQNGVNNFTKEIQNSISSEVSKFTSDLTDAQDDISKYSKYVWYAGIGVSCALLLVVVLYYMGILFGLCGERPGFGAQCCNTGTGSNFLMAGVGITFLLAWLIMLVCTILFVVGGPLYTELCRYFDDHSPKELKPFNDAVMNAVDFQKSLFNGRGVNLDLVNILEGCENNSAIYGVLQLDNMVNISQYTDLSAVRQSLNTLKQDSFNIPNVTIVTSDMRTAITDFATAGLDGIPFQDYEAEVNKSVTTGDLLALAAQLRTSADRPGVPAGTNATLYDAAAQLENLQATLVVPMERAKESLKTSLNVVKQQAGSGLKNSTDALLNGLQEAENRFNREKNTLVKSEVQTLIDRVTNRAEGLVQDMLTDVNENIGKCRPVFDSFYSATDAACVVALEPLNGLWFGIGWCLFFFIPCLIFAVKLAGLYRREHEERDFDDANFSLYEEGKQDGIPLNSRQQSGHASPRRGQDREGMANSGYQEETRMAAEYPNYKGGAVNRGYHPDPYDKPHPPPYGAPPDGRGEINPPAYSSGDWQNPRAPYSAPRYPTNSVGYGSAPDGAMNGNYARDRHQMSPY